MEIGEGSAYSQQPAQPPVLGHYAHKQINVPELLCIEIFNKNTDFMGVSDMIKSLENI
jgi:hypothetical protein